MKKLLGWSSSHTFRSTKFFSAMLRLGWQRWLHNGLRKVNTCKIDLNIAFEAKDVETVASVEVDESSPDPQKSISSQAVTPVSDEEVEDAIIRFVTVKRKREVMEEEDHKKADIDVHQYDALARKLTGIPTATILPRKFSKALHTPYEELLLAKREDLAHPQRTARLSVTKILPYNWCELRTMYRVYEGVFERPATPRMIEGKEEHAVFENQTHPVMTYEAGPMEVSIEKTHSFEEDAAEEALVEELTPEELHSIYVSSGSSANPVLQELASKWTNSILRLLTLFQFGECREVLVHSLYDVTKETLARDFHADASNYIVISGVIDHLTLESKDVEGVFEGYQEELKDSVSDFLDMRELLQQIGIVAKHWCDKSDPFLYMTVKDLKTRSSKSLPHPAQRESAKYQVGMYRKFLGMLSVDPAVTYQSLLINAKKRGVDPQAALPWPLAFALMLQNNYLMRDFQRLKEGSNIGFAPFDNEAPVKGFSLSAFGESTPDQLLGPWEKAPTLAYLAARLAQLYHTMTPFLSDQTFIEYSCKGDVFRQTKYLYSESDIDEAIDHGMQVWLGKRDFETPFIKGICKDCDFRKQCEWHLRDTGAISDI